MFRGVPKSSHIHNGWWRSGSLFQITEWRRGTSYLVRVCKIRMKINNYRWNKKTNCLQLVNKGILNIWTYHLFWIIYYVLSVLPLFKISSLKRSCIVAIGVHLIIELVSTSYITGIKIYKYLSVKLGNIWCVENK